MPAAASPISPSSTRGRYATTSRSEWGTWSSGAISARRSAPTTAPASRRATRHLAPRPENTAHLLEDLASLHAESFRARFPGSAVRRASIEGSSGTSSSRSGTRARPPPRPSSSRRGRGRMSRVIRSSPQRPSARWASRREGHREERLIRFGGTVLGVVWEPSRGTARPLNLGEGRGGFTTENTEGTERGGGEKRGIGTERRAGEEREREREREREWERVRAEDILRVTGNHSARTPLSLAPRGSRRALSLRRPPLRARPRIPHSSGSPRRRRAAAATTSHSMARAGCWSAMGRRCAGSRMRTTMGSMIDPKSSPRGWAAAGRRGCWYGATGSTPWVATGCRYLTDTAQAGRFIGDASVPPSARAATTTSIPYSVATMARFT